MRDGDLDYGKVEGCIDSLNTLRGIGLLRGGGGEWVFCSVFSFWNGWIIGG